MRDEGFPQFRPLGSVCYLILYDTLLSLLRSLLELLLVDRAGKDSTKQHYGLYIILYSTV